MKNSKIYPWVVVGLLWGVALLNYMDRQMLSTMKDAMQMDITRYDACARCVPEIQRPAVYRPSILLGTKQRYGKS